MEFVAFYLLSSAALATIGEKFFQEEGRDNRWVVWFIGAVFVTPLLAALILLWMSIPRIAAHFRR